MSDSTSGNGMAAAKHAVPLRVILPLCVAGFSGLLNVSVQAPFVAIVASDLEVTVPRIGLTATAALITTALSGLAIGWLADAAGFRRVLVSGLVFLALGGVMAALSISFLLFLGARVVGAIGFAAASGLPNAIIATRFEGSTRQRALGYISAASVLAGLVGPPLLTFVGDLTSWRVAFAMVGGFALIAGVGVRFSVPAPVPSAMRTPSPREGLRTYRRLLSNRAARFVLLATFLQMASLIGSIIYLGAFLTDETGLSVRSVGFVFAAQSVGGLIASFVAGRLPEQQSLKWYLIAMAVLAAAIATVYMMSPVFLLTIGLITLVGLAQVIAWVLLIGVLARSTTVGQGSTMVFNGSVLGAGGAAGSALGGLIIGVSGYALLGLVFAGLAVASGVAMWLASRAVPAPTGD